MGVLPILHQSMWVILSNFKDHNGMTSGARCLPPRFRCFERYERKTMKVQMETGVPIIYGILTPQEFMSEGRAEFFKEHFIKKGQEAARSILTTLDNERLLAGLLKQTG